MTTCQICCGATKPPGNTRHVAMAQMPCMVPLYSMIRSVESVLRSSLRIMVTKAAVKTYSAGKS